MDKVRQQILGFYKEVSASHNEGFLKLSRIKDQVRMAPNMEQICDLIAVLKKSEDLVRSLKSEITKTYGQLEKVVGALYVQSGEMGEPIRTDWVTASPDVKFEPSLPTLKNDPDAFVAMCNFFGVSEEAARSDAFRPHWPGICASVAKLQQELQPLPPGIDPDKLNEKYVVSCRFRKDVDLDAMAASANPEE